jgi:hypothetical protein
MRSIDDTDYGTPAIQSLHSFNPVKLEIDAQRKPDVSSARSATYEKACGEC